ncbi:XRE family transcriptional regulator [Chryseobacterium lactis]|uniref:XRE family transcriptional regulator n=1 Tax=Chryseobacterium lactis TaxID=1241981 RepID=A0A3G6RK01_CHRLC|nr:helix-turn-helix transcriptional regulator [Chryseobacterium lactis]AZA83828.1 XRE family transcriptional regulator [Chryseobacterium lactis]AZB04213.1 XRE family transcriptional regulator [Chryseobacterium lactis]PNW12879.1 XRE family transcriptional regulator [Chryseobacterium lactis]
MSLNERISKVIEYSNLTPSEFADEIDVQRSSISHITSGRNKPSLEFIIKIKSRFPELLWDWLVTGEGEMLKSELPEAAPVVEEHVEDKVRTTPLPDLFTMMNNDNEFGADETDIEPAQSSPGESIISTKDKAPENISDSQRLENSSGQILSQVFGNQENKIKRIVLFYENGKFESFEP